jgi:hypothetical protein
VLCFTTLRLCSSRLLFSDPPHRLKLPGPLACALFSPSACMLQSASVVSRSLMQPSRPCQTTDTLSSEESPITIADAAKSSLPNHRHPLERREPWTCHTHVMPIPCCCAVSEPRMADNLATPRTSRFVSLSYASPRVCVCVCVCVCIYIYIYIYICRVTEEGI